MSAISRIHRYGRNVGGYSGETIDIQQVLREIQAAALKDGWRRSFPIPTNLACWLTTVRRQARKRIYLERDSR
jgi:hypothetical protein